MFRNLCTSRHPAHRDPASSTQPIRTDPFRRSAALSRARADATTSPSASAPLNLGHVSTAENQASELIDQAILLTRIVGGKILLEFPEKIPLAILLAFQSDANQRGDCLAHARIDRVSVPRHLIGQTGSQPDGIARSGFARMIPRLPVAARAALGCRLGVRHMSSECLIPMQSCNSPPFSAVCVR